MFAALLRAARPVGLSQQVVADRLGVARETVSLWERGDHVPPADDLACLLGMYNVDAETRLRIYDAAASTHSRRKLAARIKSATAPNSG